MDARRRGFDGNALARRLTSMELPVIASPLFLISNPDLVVACCRAGVVGTFPALNQRTSDGFADWLDQVESNLDEGDAPYGVNLIVHSSNERLDADLQLCIDHKVPLIITSLGAANEVVERTHAYGGLVFHDVTTVEYARKAALAGVDGLILVGSGAGGHAGALSPFAFVAEVRRFFEGFIVLAGCLTSGRDVAAARVLGADFAYMGTRFIATTEASAPAGYKQMILDSSTSDIVYTPAISSLPANFMAQSIVDNGIDLDRLPRVQQVNLSHITDPHRELDNAGDREAKPWRDIWSAGQGVAGIDEIVPAEELVAQLRGEYRWALAEITAST